jgi:hypothetical protein
MHLRDPRIVKRNVCARVRPEHQRPGASRAPVPVVASRLDDEPEIVLMGECNRGLEVRFRLRDN